MDRFVDHAPADTLRRTRVVNANTLTVPPARQAFTMAVSFRPSYKNLLKAEELLDQFMVNEDEAFVAYLLVQALPKDAHDAFFRGALAGVMRSHLSEAERFAGDNYYSGGEGNRDRASLLSQLEDPELWKDENAAEFDGVVRMVLAANEREYLRAQLLRHVPREPKSSRRHEISS